MILNPYFLAGLLVAFLIVFGGGYDLGAKHARNKAAADQLEAFEQARLDAIEQANADQKTAQQYETAHETVRTVYVKIKEKAHANIEKHADYDECRLDAGGLRLYNSNPNHPEATAPGVDRSLPGFAGGFGWQAVDDLAKQPGTRGTVLHLPGAAPSTVGMGSTVAGSAEIARAE